MSTSFKTPKYEARVNGIQALANFFQIEIEEILESYVGEFFQNSDIDKTDLFRQCLNLELSSRNAFFLNSVCKLVFHKDSRSSVEYGLELVFGWILEDILTAILRKLSYKIERNGGDKFREFLDKSNISTSADLVIQAPGKKTHNLEIVTAWNNHWTRTNVWDLRESKFIHLISPHRTTICLGIELPSLRFFITNLHDSAAQFEKRSNPAWGGKTAYSYLGIRGKLFDIEFMDSSLKSFIAEIK